MDNYIFKDGTKIEIEQTFLRTIYSKTRIGTLKTNIKVEFVFKSQGTEYKSFSCKLMGSIGQNFRISQFSKIDLKIRQVFGSIVSPILTSATQFDAKDPKAQCRVQKCIR